MKKRHFESTNSLFPEEAFAPLPEKGQPDDIPHPTRADYNDLFEHLSRSAFRSGFRAQHATGCCCRGCFYKWHHIPPGRMLTAAEQEYAVNVLLAWIDQEMNRKE